MTIATDWRRLLFSSGCYVLLSTVAVWAIGFIAVNSIEPVHAKIRTGAWVFLIGCLMSIVAAVLIMFGQGWKQRWLVLIALLELPFWFGFTLY